MIQPYLPLWATAILILGVVPGLYVGLRLLKLSYRTREWPEFALGFFVVSTVLGVMLAVVASALELPHYLALALGGLGQLTIVVGAIVLLQATRSIFRTGSPAAGVLVVAIGATLLGSWAWLVAGGGDPSRPAEVTAASAVLLLARLVGIGWWTIEAFLYASRLRRRASLGLSDSWMVHRALLWAFLGVSVAVAISVLGIAGWILEGRLETSPLALSLLGLCQLAASIASYLAFFPPTSYAMRFRSAEPA